MWCRGFGWCSGRLKYSRLLRGHVGCIPVPVAVAAVILNGTVKSVTK